MSKGKSTCWTVIRGAADGSEEDLDEFAARYAPAVEAYLKSRWRGGPLVAEVEDAVQEVFLECIREGGALEKADPGRPGGFRAFLYGIVRNVARRVEVRRGRRQARDGGEVDPDELESPRDGFSTDFDRAWARVMIREARARQESMAREEGPDAVRRLELLHLRFYEGMPIREIARLWSADPDQLHRDYAKARREFREALFETVAFHHPATGSEIERECASLLAILG